MNTIKYMIHENALTTDYIEKCKSGYYFKGHGGSTYKLVYYTYANEWGDRENIIFGKTLEAVLKKYDQLTKRLDDQQEYLAGEAKEDGSYDTTRELAEAIEYAEE